MRQVAKKKKAAARKSVRKRAKKGAAKRRPARAAKKKTARRATPKRTAKKKAVRKAAPKRAAKKKSAPKRTARKKAARRAAPKRAAKKKVTRRAAPKRTAKKKVTRRAAPKRAAKKKPARRAATARTKKPAAKRRPPRKPAPASFPQRQGASARLIALFEMARARTTVLAAIQGMLPGTAEQPHAEGKWNTRQHVLHLAYWDQVFVADAGPALQGVRPAFATYSKEDDDRVNAAAIENMNHMTWDEALRLLHAARQRLLAFVEAVAEDAEVWVETHPFGGILRSATRHDRHHADAIKRWRSEQNA